MAISEITENYWLQKRDLIADLEKVLNRDEVWIAALLSSSHCIEEAENLPRH